jgi:hypothetical protein
MRPGHLLPAVLLLAAVLSSGCFELDLLLGTGEAVICQNVPVDAVGVDRDHCVQDAAIRKSDAELCADIERPPPESKCYMLIAEKEMDPSYCEDMEDNPGPTGEYSRLECLQRVAIAAGDPSVCEKMGSARSSGMFASFSREDCLRAVGAGKTAVDIYNANRDRYEYCQDLAYTQIFKKPPDSTADLGPANKIAAGGERKAAVGSKLLADYTVTAEGRVEKGSSPQVTLQDGDIIVFEFDGAPDPKNAAHYAVVQGGTIRQVLAFKQGGALDQQPRDLSWFFDTRTVTNPYTGVTSTSPRIYQYYTVYHRK